MIIMEQTAPKSQVDIVKDAHAAFKTGDMETVLGLLDDDIEWIAPTGTAHGPTAVQEEIWTPFFELLEENGASFYFDPDTFVSDGDDVAVFGRGIMSKNGETLEVPIAQHWRVNDGKVTYLHGYPDTAQMFGFLGVDA